MQKKAREFLGPSILY